MNRQNPSFFTRNQYSDIMLDLETFATNNNAAIVSIGAVAFNADGENGALFTNSPDLLANIGQGFRMNIDLAASTADKRGDIDPATVMWWLQQSAEARASLAEGGVPMGEALQAFANWIRRIAEKPMRLRLWSNGPTFDETILRAAYDRYGMDLPLSFRGSRCCRTMIELAEMHGWDRGQQSGEGLIAHDALSDAVRQARGVVSQRHFLRVGDPLAERLARSQAGTSSGPGEIT